MAAATEPRMTKEREGAIYVRGVAGAVKIFEGTLVALSATGYAQPGATSTTLIADGMACETVDNLAGAAGVKTIKIKKGEFYFANSAAGDLITRAEIGDQVYIVDDQTVAKTSGGATRTIAGKVTDVDAKGVWVKVG